MRAAAAPQTDFELNAADRAAQSAQARAADAPSAATRLTVTADADPGLLPRMLETVLRRGATPVAVDARMESDSWRVAMTLDGLLHAEIRHVAAGLSGLIGVRAVTVEDAPS